MVIALIAAATLAAAQSDAPAQECRDSSYTAADGREGSMRYCKDAAGIWRRVAGVALPQPPFPTSASVTFRGTYAAAVSVPGRPARRIDLNTLLNSGGTSQRLEGAITIAARFDGPAAYAQISGTGGISPTNLSGLIRDGQCRLVDANQTIEYQGSCGRPGFKGTIRSLSGSRRTVKGSFETTVAEVRSLDER